MKRGALVAALFLLATGCATLRELAALRRVEFRMDGIGGVRVAGIDVGSKRSLSDFGVLDAARLTAAFADGKLPLTMVVDVQAENPADNGSNARFLAMEWTLRLQGNDTVSGRVDREMSLSPGVPATIPVQVDLDLLEFFDEGVGDLIALVGGISGLGGETTDVELMLLPTIETPLGPMTFPEPVRVAKKTVGG